jgi:hypothetical protein
MSNDIILQMIHTIIIDSINILKYHIVNISVVIIILILFISFKQIYE